MYQEHYCSTERGKVVYLFVSHVFSERQCSKKVSTWATHPTSANQCGCSSCSRGQTRTKFLTIIPVWSSCSTRFTNGRWCVDRKRRPSWSSQGKFFTRFRFILLCCYMLLTLSSVLGTASHGSECSVRSITAGTGWGPRVRSISFPLPRSSWWTARSSSTLTYIRCS